MAKIGELYVAITGDNSSLKTALNDSSTQTKKFSSDTMAGLAKMATGWLSVGVAISKVWEETNKLSKTTASVAAATGASAKEMEAFTKAAYGMADMGKSADEAMQAIEALAKAGISTSDILGGALAGAMTLASAGSTDVGFAAETAASAMTQFGLSGKDVTHIADLLAAGAGKAQGEVSDMAMALSQAGLVASQAGLSIEETVGSLTAMASAGLLGSDAGTSFRNMLLRLTPVSKEAKDQMDALGISAFDSSGQFIGMAEYAGKLQKALEGMSQEQKQAALVTMFGTDSIRAANILINQGEAGMRKWTDTVNKAGYAQQVADTKLKSLNGEFDKTVAAVNNTASNLGTKLAPAITVVFEGIQGLAMIIDGVVNVGADIIGFINDMTAGLGGVAIAAGLAGVALMAAFGPVGLLVGGISFAVGLIAKGLDDNAKAQEKLNAEIKKGTEYLYDYTIAGALAEKQSLKKAQAEIEAAKKASKAASDAKSSELLKYMKDYEDFGKTALQVLDEEEAAAIETAKKLGASEADLQKIRGTFLEQRKQMYLDDAKAAALAAKARADAVIAEDEKLAEEQKKIDIERAEQGQASVDGLAQFIEDFNQWVIDDAKATADAENAVTEENAKNKIAVWTFLVEQYGEKALEMIDLETLSTDELMALNDVLTNHKVEKSDEMTEYLKANAVSLTETEKSELDKRVQYWNATSSAIMSGVQSVSTTMGVALTDMSKGWGGLANAAIKAIAQIVRAMASELAASGTKALAEAIALSLNPLTLPAAPGKYAEAAGYAAGVGGIYAAAGAIETLANFGAGTSAVPRTGSYIVGEYGPEMVTLPRGASVKTNAVTEASMGATYRIEQNFYSPKAISAIEADRLSRRAMREQRAFA